MVVIAGSPTPTSDMTCVAALPFSALSVRVSIPPLPGALVGAKSTATVQVSPAARGVEVEQVVLGSTVKPVLAKIPVKASASLPMFSATNVCAPLVWPTTVLLNSSVGGVASVSSFTS